MSARLDAIGFVVADMEATLAFYRLLGLDLPETADEGHVETTTEGGLRLMWDTVDVVRSFSTAPPTQGSQSHQRHPQPRARADSLTHKNPRSQTPPRGQTGIVQRAPRCLMTSATPCPTSTAGRRPSRSRAAAAIVDRWPVPHSNHAGCDGSILLVSS